jgi:hypothetical protein
VFDVRVLRITLGPKRDEVSEQFRVLNNEVTHTKEK